MFFPNFSFGPKLLDGNNLFADNQQFLTLFFANNFVDSWKLRTLKPTGTQQQRRPTATIRRPLLPAWSVLTSASASLSQKRKQYHFRPKKSTSSKPFNQDVPTTTRLPSCPRHQNGVIQVFLHVCHNICHCCHFVISVVTPNEWSTWTTLRR